MSFILQCKGKDLDKVPVSKLDNGLYIFSQKYDGNYVQIHKIGNCVTFYSSGGKIFKIKNIEEELCELNIDFDFIVEAEYIGETEGLLGDRNKCSTTTFRTNTAKGIENFNTKINFKVFDILYFHNKKLTSDSEIMEKDFEHRIEFFRNLNFGNQIQLVEFETLTLERGKHKALYMHEWMNYEGLFGKKPSHMYSPNKRVNDAIKIKFYPKRTLPFIGIKEGKGKYTGMIGSLILREDDGTEVFISGMSDELRKKDASYFEGKKVLFEYESYKNTYVQARFKELINE